MSEMLKVCDLFSRTSRGPGNREYITGVMAGVKILIFKVHDPQPDGPTHTLFLAQRPPRQERDLPVRGKATSEVLRGKAADFDV